MEVCDLCVYACFSVFVWTLMLLLIVCKAKFYYVFRCVLFRVIQVYHYLTVAGLLSSLLSLTKCLFFCFSLFAFQSNCYSRVITVDGQKKIIIFASRRYQNLSFCFFNSYKFRPFPIDD